MGRTRLELRPSPVTFILVMRILTVNLKRTVTALGVALLLSGPAWAGPDIPALLEKLRTASEEEAKRAERDLERAWASSGSASMDLLLKRGRDALGAGEVKKAIEHFTALTDHAPDFAEGWNARATAYFQAGLFGPAMGDLERALALNPDNFNAIFGLGVMFQEMGDVRRAALLYRRVLTLNPHHENAADALSALKREGIGRTL